MNYLRIIGLIAGAGALIGAVAWIFATFHKAELVDGYRVCTAAARTPAAPLDQCDVPIRERVTIARRAAACDAALAAKPLDLFGVNTACSAAVKAVFARGQVAERNLVDTAAQLASAIADRDTAVARAEARNRTTTDRKTAHDRTIETAPRTDDGRVRCDAQCLRDLAR